MHCSLGEFLAEGPDGGSLRASPVFCEEARGRSSAQHGAVENNQS